MEKTTNEFDYELMNTTLKFLLPAMDARDAKSASYDCFGKLEIVEDLISMFKYGSDISMINESPVGSVVKIADSTFECLKSAFAACEMSGGAIDITMGEFFMKNKGVDRYGKIETPRRGKFAFDDENYYVKKLEEGKMDLGAIGKGYALDKVAEILEDTWGVKNAFVSFGASSVYAVGRDENGEEWRVNLSDDVSVPLDGAFVGASGTAVLGEHIIDCRTGEIPQNQPFRAWAFSGNGAISDAMSTAFMILSRKEIADICAKYDISAAIQQTADSPVEFID